ncbi:MAG: deoxyribodipyrimidine photo-lyase [Alphaproteobacteria bacterium]|nr:deoxyribodipyrimidine photo-lyase [Alphaproteobacteria bacterium]
MKILHWFRQDLRLHDNPAFSHAAEHTIFPVYIFDETEGHPFPIGSASKWWLHHSLKSLKDSLLGNLSLYRGSPQDILLKLVEKHKIQKVVWNRCYDPWRIQQDKVIKLSLREKGIEVESFNGSLLWEPFDVLKKEGNPYQVFTPFYQNGCLKGRPPRKTIATVTNPIFYHDTNSLSVENLSLLSKQPWEEKFHHHWTVGEQAAQKRLEVFVEDHLSFYKNGRDFPAQYHVSKLSPYLHFGEISPHQLWEEINQIEPNLHTECFLKELGWREFSHYLLYHFPTLPSQNFQKKFDAFPWENNETFLNAWKSGETGYPIIDAGMRELWQTGYMHNRIRMIVGSFLIKNLLIHWKKGEQWFWDCLLDADLANNSAGWQWVAGSGADAAPYFRIFNPTTQAKKFDPEGIYIKKFVPELKELPIAYLFEPWKAPLSILEKAKIIIGKTYPHPIVDLGTSRQKALFYFSTL